MPFCPGRSLDNRCELVCGRRNQRAVNHIHTSGVAAVIPDNEDTHRKVNCQRKGISRKSATVRYSTQPGLRGRPHPESMYTDCMHSSNVRPRAALLVLALTAAVTVAWQARLAASEEPVAPGLAAELRYIGRDPLTGMPARVDDRFIAAVEKAIERYGKDRGEPVPPPPAGPVDIATLSVPSLGMVAAPVGRFGLDAYGRLDVPQDTRTVGWNPDYNDLPGEAGATFFAAHYEYQGTAGVFFRLSSLAPGAEIEVALTDGSRHRYRVTSNVEYALGAIDMGAILRGREGRESITLMTCSGPANEGEYALRTVVLAERAD